MRGGAAWRTWNASNCVDTSRADTQCLHQRKTNFMPVAGVPWSGGGVCAGAAEHVGNEVGDPRRVRFDAFHVRHAAPPRAAALLPREALQLTLPPRPPRA